MQDKVLRVRDQLEDLGEVNPAEWRDAVMAVGKNGASGVECLTTVWRLSLARLDGRPST